MTITTTHLHPPSAATASPGGAAPTSVTPALLDALAAGAERSDRSATLVAAHDPMVAGGLFHLLVPRELGGSGASIVDWFDCALTLSRVDPSAGWLMAQGAMQSAWIATAGSDELVAEFFAVRQTLASSSAGQVAAERQTDHYRLRNARWAYTSGSPGAAYLGGMVLTTGADSAPETRMAIVPAQEATITANWNTLGLRGTASHDISFGDDVIIPAVRTFTWPRLTINRPGALATALAHTGWAITLSAAAVNLGAAERSIEAATASAEHKKHRFDTETLLHQPPFIRGIAELHGSVDLARTGLRTMLDQVWERASHGVPPDAETRARLRLAAATAVETGAGVVRAAQGLVGADALHRSHPLERLGRDTQMLLHHVAASPSTRQQLGQVILGTYQGPIGLI